MSKNAQCPERTGTFLRSAAARTPRSTGLVKLVWCDRALALTIALIAFAFCMACVAGPAIAQTPTTTTISTSANPVFGGERVTLTVNVAGAGGTPTGNVTIVQSCNFTCGVGFVTLATVPLTNGQATFETPALTTYGAGQSNYLFKAIYAGEPSFSASESAVLTQSLSRGTTATAVTSTANPSLLGQSVTLTATVTALTGVSNFTTNFSDDLIFYDGSVEIGRRNINAGGQVSLTTSALGLGSHSITARFAGAIEHTGSTSPPLTQVVWDTDGQRHHLSELHSRVLAWSSAHRQPDAGQWSGDLLSQDRNRRGADIDLVVQGHIRGGRQVPDG